MKKRAPGVKPITVDPEARALFLEAVADATPLQNDRVHFEPDPPPAYPQQRLRDEQSALNESLYGPPLLDLHLEGGDEAAWARSGIARSVLRDLRRGRWTAQAHLDLHGCNRDEARQLCADFLAQAHRRGVRCLRIVHGKGLGSPGREPVLKRLVLGWLTQRQEVLAFCQTCAADGGAGAVAVLLRGPR